jgi:hypothetical protein
MKNPPMSTEQPAIQLRAAVALTAAVIVIAACGGASNVGTASSPGAAATASSPVPSPSPAASPTPTSAQTAYTVHLTFSGGLATTVTQTKVNANSGCGAGRIDVDIVVNSQDWSLSASVDGYHGPGSYAAGSAFNLMLSAPNYDIWMSTSGAATYAGDTSLSVDVVMTNLMAGPGEPGASAHLKGTISCA